MKSARSKSVRSSRPGDRTSSSAGLRRQHRSLLALAKSEPLGSGDLTAALREITETAAPTLGVERVGIWLFDDKRLVLRCADLFEKRRRKHTSGSELAARDYPAYFLALEKNRAIAAHDARVDPRTREFRTSYLSVHGISSMLDTPIRSGGRVRGVVCHERVGPPRRWTVEEQNFAASIGDYVSLALESSQRSQAEESMRRSERHFRSLIENALDVITVIDADARILYLSPSIERVLAYKPEELLGMQPYHLFHPDDLPEVMREREKGLARPGIVHISVRRVLHKNGAWRYLEIVSHNLLHDEAVSGVILNFRDITERKLAEDLLRDYSRELEARVEERTGALKEKNEELRGAIEQLRQTQAQLVLQEKLAALGSLVAGVAHEINNPLGAVVSAADTSDRCLIKLLSLVDLAQNLDDLRRDAYFQELVGVLSENNRVTVHAANRIANIVRSLKNFARLDEAELQKADIHEGIESTLTLIQHEIKNRVTVIKDFGELPRIYCYPNQLNQVFLNLLMNASQAIDGAGTIRIRTYSEPRHVHIKIADSGRGISPDHIDRIFDPGFTTKGVGVGTGLGLSISYNIVQKHHGILSVEGKPGKGSEFTVSLPIAAPRDRWDGSDLRK